MSREPRFETLRHNSPSLDYSKTRHSFSRGDLHPTGKVVLLHLLSHSQGHKPTKAKMARDMGVRREYVHRGLKEAENGRFLVRQPVIRAADGEQVNTVYHVSDIQFAESDVVELRRPIVVRKSVQHGANMSNFRTTGAVPSAEIRTTDDDMYGNPYNTESACTEIRTTEGSETGTDEVPARKSVQGLYANPYNIEDQEDYKSSIISSSVVSSEPEEEPSKAPTFEERVTGFINRVHEAQDLDSLREVASMAIDLDGGVLYPSRLRDGLRSAGAIGSSGIWRDCSDCDQLRDALLSALNDLL